MYLVERIQMVHRLLRLSSFAPSGPSCDTCSVDNFDGGSLLDVGAHRGVYSFWMHRRFRDLPVVAFEPQPELVEFLADLKQTFHWSEW